jgi:hypothetical protein
MPSAARRRQKHILIWDYSEIGLFVAPWPGATGVTTSTHTDEYQVVTGVLKDARKGAALTQKDVADRLKKPQSYVAKVEGGERRIDIVEFIAIARAMEIDPIKLFRSVLKNMGIQ